jgi:hypothetical protein
MNNATFHPPPKSPASSLPCVPSAPLLGWGAARRPCGPAALPACGLGRRRWCSAPSGRCRSVGGCVAALVPARRWGSSLPWPATIDLNPGNWTTFCENLAVSHQEVDMPFRYSSEFRREACERMLAGEAVKDT